jgi:4'-phosphopantetheinyl transferase
LSALPQSTADRVVEVSTLDNDTIEAPILRSLVTSPELVRSLRFARSADAQLFLLRRALVRLAAARALRTLPWEVTIRRRCPFCAGEDHGPSTALSPMGEGVAVSSTSSGGRAVVAVSQGRAVGIDIEVLRSPFPLSPDDTQLFSRLERKTMTAVSPAQADKRRYEIWVRKEAVTKCLGTGLTAALAEIECSKNGDTWVTASATPEVIAYQDVPMGDDYVAAVAVSAPPAQVVRIQCEPPAIGEAVSRGR